MGPPNLSFNHSMLFFDNSNFVNLLKSLSRGIRRGYTQTYQNLRSHDFCAAKLLVDLELVT